MNGEVVAEANFEILARGSGRARVGRLRTAHGDVETPAFIPVGTAGSVKGMTPADLEGLGCRIVLANAYHLMLRPGDEKIAALGGLHEFMAWPGAILTDSGGFQAMSLSPLVHVTDDGISFRSHLDGSSLFLSPERAIDAQENLGSDIMMALDLCLPYPSERGDAERAVSLTAAWGRRCKDRFEARRGARFLYGIAQGGFYADLRRRSAQEITAIGFDGYAIGGLAVGEPPAQRREMLEAVLPHLPVGRPRYLMGVGMPEELLCGAFGGIDLFDCVVPTRHARNGFLFTSFGRLLIKNAAYSGDKRPIDPLCGCPTCRTFSRAYLRHLYSAGEVLSVRLLTLHNLYYHLSLMRGIRAAIRAGREAEFQREFRAAREGSDQRGEEGMSGC